MDAFAIHVVRGQLERRADGRPPAQHDDRRRRLRQARRACSARRSTEPRSADRRCRSCTASTASSRRSRRARLALHGHRADHDEAGQRGDAGQLLRAGARARVLPAERRGHAALPLARRAGASDLAVGRPLRRRHAEVEQAPGHGGARPHDRRLDHALPRRPARRCGRRTSASERARRRSVARSGPASAAISTAATGFGSRTPTRTRRSSRGAGSAEVGELVQSDLGTRRLKPGRYRYTLRSSIPVNPAPPTVRAGPVFRLP